MGGIVAIVNFDGEPVDPAVLRAMAEQCAYRGPDGIRYWIQGHVGLAHLALHATPEALRETQPLLGEAGSLCLVADARVDNRLELIHLLQAKGAPVSDASTDADLILAAYCEWGEACPKHIIGDYAFAIWDACQQQLFCARDAFGIKALHYSRQGSLLCVASEAQQIIQHPKIPRILDEITVADFLVGNYNAETRTMFQGVSALPAAHLLIANTSGSQSRRYWDIDPEYRITYKNDDEYAAHFLEIFQRSVADRLRSPTPTIGITMSGGLDSTSVAAVAHKLMKSQNNGQHLLACSEAFDTLTECDERKYSQLMRDELGIEVIYVPAENFWFLDNERDFTPSLESPFMVEESVTRHMLSIFMERNAGVWLTGHGGDDLVGGNSLYFADRIAQGDFFAFSEIMSIWHRSKLPLTTLISLYRNWVIRPLIPKTLRKYYKQLTKEKPPEWMTEDFVKRSRVIDRFARSTFQFSKERARQAIYEAATGLGGGRFTIAWSERIAAPYHIDARHPFLDQRLAEFVIAIPPNQLFRLGRHKDILRRSMKGILPENIRTRYGKTEFSSYLGLGFRNKEVDRIKTLINTSTQSRLDLVYLTKMLGVFEQYLSEGRSSDLIVILRFVSLELWLRKHFSHRGV